MHSPKSTTASSTEYAFLPWLALLFLNVTRAVPVAALLGDQSIGESRLSLTSGRGSLLRSSYSHPVSSLRTAPALISRLPLSRAAVPFGQWNVCNASWAPPVLFSRGCWRFVAGRWIACGELEPMVPCGTGSPLFCLAGNSMSGSQIPASDVPRRGSVLRIGADSTGGRSAWQPPLR